MAGKYLDTGHTLQRRVKDIHSVSDLYLHMIQEHSIKTANMTKGELAKYHLLAHALEAFPELQELLDNA